MPEPPFGICADCGRHLNDGELFRGVLCEDCDHDHLDCLECDPHD